MHNRESWWSIRKLISESSRRVDMTYVPRASENLRTRENTVRTILQNQLSVGATSLL